MFRWNYRIMLAHFSLSINLIVLDRDIHPYLYNVYVLIESTEAWQSCGTWTKKCILSLKIWITDPSPFFFFFWLVLVLFFPFHFSNKGVDGFFGSNSKFLSNIYTS